MLNQNKLNECFIFIVALFSGSNIDSRDIVDGHREKTLSLLWKIIFTFHVSIRLCVYFLNIWNE